MDNLAPVLILARFQTASKLYCHRAAKRILRYLRGTHTYGVKSVEGSLTLDVFVDADYAGDTLDRKSMSGFMIKLEGAVCSWNEKSSFRLLFLHVSRSTMR